MQPIRAITGALALSIPLAAVAERTAEQLEEVQVTAGRTEQTVTEVSAGVSVVGTEEIAAAAPAIATDLLRGVAGAFVQQTTPGQGVPIIRGLRGSEVLHLVDGFRLNNAWFRNAPNQYVALVDARMLERIEVVRGPSSSLYGSDAMGGVVQFVSALPQVGVEPAFGGRAGLDYRSADEALTGHLAIDQAGERVGYSAYATYHDAGDRRSGDDTRLGATAYTARAARAVVRFRPEPEHDLVVDVQYLRQPGTPRHDELVAGFGQTQPSSAEFSFEPNDRLLAHVRHRWSEVGDLVDDLEMHLGLQVMHDDRRTRDTGSTSLRRERNKSVLSGFTLQARSSPAWHRLTYGLELYADEISSSRTATDIDTAETATVTSRFPDGSTMDSIAVYLHDSVHAGKRLTLDGGLRYSRFDVSLPAADRGVSADIDADDLTANLGLVYELDPEFNLVANIGRGFRAPNVFDLATLGPRPGNRFNIANPGLGPEEVITVDLGLKYASRRLVAEAMLWQADYRDKIESVPTGDIDASGRIVVQSRNIADVDLWGAEAGVRWLLSDHFRLSGVINYTRGEQRDGAGTQQPADRIPPLNGELGIGFRPAGPWSFEGSARFARGQDRLSDRDGRDPRIDPSGTAGWVVLDAMAAVELNDLVDLTLRLDNILDRRYREHASGIDAPGRSLGLSVAARF